MLAAITTELLIVIKFGEGMFPIEFPFHVIVGWTIFVIAVVGYAIYKFILYDRIYTETDKNEIEEEASQTESETDSNRELRRRRKPVSYKEYCKLIPIFSLDLILLSKTKVKGKSW